MNVIIARQSRFVDVQHSQSAYMYTRVERYDYGANTIQLVHLDYHKT